LPLLRDDGRRQSYLIGIHRQLLYKKMKDHGIEG